MKKVIAVVLSSVVSFGAFAAQDFNSEVFSYTHQSANPWKDHKTTTYTTEINPNLEKDFAAVSEANYSVEIDMSVTAKKSIYLTKTKYYSTIKNPESNSDIAINHFTTRKTISVCELNKSDEPETIVLNVNGTNVKFFAWCNLYSDSDSKTYQSLTPQTNAGDNFLHHAFTKGKNVIIKRWGDKPVEVSAMGFSKAWSDFGEDAI